MKPRFLFPHWSRYAGYACIIGHVPIMAFGKMVDFGNRVPGTSNGQALFNSQHLFFIATALLMLIGLFLVAFSKERMEDEQISQLRLDSLQWAVYFNYLLLIISLVITNTENYPFVLECNLWAPLVFFILRFRWVIFKLNQSLKSANRS